ncbi:MAG: hypothetical protein V5B30_16010 [Candidatus Accumulibacter delftensis]|jgi:hypothetical protein
MLEKLNRYETHLDRKFERTLAMLLKLKSLRTALKCKRREKQRKARCGKALTRFWQEAGGRIS